MANAASNHRPEEPPLSVDRLNGASVFASQLVMAFRKYNLGDL
jgi:hypothetical protein